MKGENARIIKMRGVKIHIRACYSKAHILYDHNIVNQVLCSA